MLNITHYQRNANQNHNEVPLHASQDGCYPKVYKGHLFWVLVPKCLVGLHRTSQLQLLQRYCSGYRLGLPWYWMEMNKDHSVIFEIASKYCISDSFVDYDGYSISSKGFLPTGVDIMVISVKFTHSRPF